MRNIFLLSLIALYFTVSTSYVQSISSLYQHQPHTPMLKTSNKFNKLTKMTMTEGYVNIQQYVNDNNANFTHRIKEGYQNIIDPYVNIKMLTMPSTQKEINISSIYLNLEKVKGMYFSKDVNNVIFTFSNDLSDLYYYDINYNDTKGGLYKVSNNTRINMKNLKRVVFQSFNNNNIDGILF